MKRRRVVLAALAASVLGVGVATVVVPASADDPRAGLQNAAVSLGDSAASGEGARNYEPATDEVGVNQCHRSLESYIHEAQLAGIEQTINIACSGADSTNLEIAGESRWGEPSQADQLATLATQYDVELVTVQIGANDDPAFADTVLECVGRWAIAFGPGCRDTVGAEWPDRVEAMKPKAASAVSDVQKVMAAAGYNTDDYELVVVSYASPVTEQMRRITHALEGCPLRIDDAEWGRTVATQLLTDALREVAAGADARFLDLSRATEGHEACNKNVSPSQHWVRGVTVRVADIVEGIDSHLVQESFHPNAKGHHQMGNCLGEFVASDLAEAACLVGDDGNVHAVG